VSNFIGKVEELYSEKNMKIFAEWKILRKKFLR